MRETALANCSTCATGVRFVTDAPTRAPKPPPSPYAWASLLGSFYARAGLHLPPLERLRGPAMPQPYRKLLVHSNDMTSTLEGFYGDAVGLRVLARVNHGDVYEREVVLCLSRTLRPVEYGAIRIHLDHFAEQTRRVILSERQPFGNILESEGIAYVCWPQAFFLVPADAHMGRLLDLRERRELYGRRNVVLDESRRLLAEVIEILAPVPGDISNSGKT